MSIVQLATRLGVSRQAVADQERRETEGGITLEALQKTADAMGCDLFYAIVPRQPINEMLKLRARKVAAHRLSAIAKSMALEDQAVPSDEFEDQVDSLADQIYKDLPRELWTEPTA